MVSVRAIHFAATMLFAGVVFFIVFVTEPTFRAANVDLAVRAIVQSRIGRLTWISLVLATISGAAWLVLTAVEMSDRPLVAVLSEDILWVVLSQTNFGRAWFIRFLLVCIFVVALGAFRSPQRVQAGWFKAAMVVLAAAFVGTLAWAGHAAGNSGIDGVVHGTADILHLIGAAAWVGALLPLALLLWVVKGDKALLAMGRAATLRFSTVGIASVGTLLATGIVNSWYLVGSLAALVGTSYGRLLLVKVGLYFGMVGMAAINRFRLTSRLGDDPPTTATQRALYQLRRNSLIELAIGAIVLVIVAVLGTIPPGLHRQATWPFSFRPNPMLLSDEQLRISFFLALGVAAAGMVLIVVALTLQRGRWSGFAIGVIGVGLLFYVVQGLAALTTPAYPTTYYVSPTNFSAASIAAGERLFAMHCASCHGPHGRGDGPAGPSMARKPADLTADHVYYHSDGDLFWHITSGIADAMPEFRAILDEGARWNLIDFIRAKADATRLQRFAGGTSAAFPSPKFFADCANQSTVFIGQGQSSYVHIAIAKAASDDWLRHLVSSDSKFDVLTVIIAINWTPTVDFPICFTEDPNVVKTFALYSGDNGDQISGAEFLIDLDGNLRSMWHPALAPGSTKTDMLKQRIEGLQFPPAHVRPVGAHNHVH
jgi:putative copper resistance protein D